MPEFFKIGPILGQELLDAHRAVYELERDGFIQTDPGQDSSFKLLTERGRAVVRDNLENMRLPATDIDQLLSDEDLKALVRDDFLSGDYATAIFKAFRMLEERTRALAGEPAGSVGVVLMTSAFRQGGILRHPDAQLAAEEDGLHQLMRGAMAWFKNPTSHRTVGYSDEQQAAHTLAFANLLLDLLGQCIRR